MTKPGCHIELIVSEPFAENTYVAHLPDRSDCVVFDPGFDPQAILDYLDDAGLAPAAILNTHGHVDHIAGNGALKERWPDVPLVIGENDAVLLTDPMQNLSGLYGFGITSPPADRTLTDDERFSVAGFEFEIREIPGHSPGHIVFLYRGEEPWIVFGGDVLFAGSVGRTDFPGGSFEQLAEGIHKKLFRDLPDATRVLPGHGPDTTIGDEKRSNPFVGAGIIPLR